MDLRCCHAVEVRDCESVTYKIDISKSGREERKKRKKRKKRRRRDEEETKKKHTVMLCILGHHNFGTPQNCPARSPTSLLLQRKK